MREVEARSRTRLKVQREDEMDPMTKERYVDIVGTRGEQRAALEMLLKLTNFCRDDEGEVLKDTRPTGDGDGKTDATPHVVEVLPEEVGRVLGRKGETVKVLERESNTKIEVEKATGRLEIFGRVEGQERATELILEEVSYAKTEDGTVLKDARQKPRDPEAIELPPLRLWVRDRDAGRVIGRGGETVRDVMEKTGADIKVQKSDDMAPGETERGIKIFGTKEQQDQALQLVLGEVSWARGEDGILKSPPEEAPKPREEKRRERRRGARGDRKGPASADDDEEARGGRGKGGGGGGGEGGSGCWVCATCGGDHRTKECPHAQGILGMGMQIGMQMGMQALGMGMGMMGPPMMPPMMGMGGLPMPMGPGAMMRGDSSDSSSGCSSSGAGSIVSRGPGRARGTAVGPDGQPGGSTLSEQDLPPGDLGSMPPQHRRRRRRSDLDVGDPMGVSPELGSAGPPARSRSQKQRRKRHGHRAVTAGEEDENRLLPPTAADEPDGDFAPCHEDNGRLPLWRREEHAGRPADRNNRRALPLWRGRPTCSPSGDVGR